jgi:hypothetical protein
LARSPRFCGGLPHDCPVWWISTIPRQGTATPNALGRLRFTGRKTVTAQFPVQKALPARMPPLQTARGVAANLLRTISFDSAGPVVRICKRLQDERLQDEKEASMTRSLILGAAALAFSSVAASAQAIYVSPGYVAAPTYVAPAYVAPSFVAPPVYVVPSAPIYGSSAPIYGYSPGVVDAYTVTEPDWAW